MNSNRITRYLLGVLTAATLIMAPACKKSGEESKEMKDVATKVDELNSLSQKANTDSADQAQKLKTAGVNDMKPNPDTLQLTDEQKKVLEDRIKSEKDSSYRALLQDVIEKDKDIKDLNEKITKLKESLPQPDKAKPGDNHYSMAIKFLKKQGVSNETARKLVSRVNIMEKLAPGFEVYHFYSNGSYGTWVSQGKAKISPTDLIRGEREKVENERDTAVAQGEKLQEDVNDLQTQKAQVMADIAKLQTEKTKLLDDMAQLNTQNEGHKAKLNSLHYVVAERTKLVKDEIIVVPTFAKDRAGANWADQAFDKTLDLRANDTLTFTASDAGVKQISKVIVVPGSLQKDKHYTLEISADKQSVNVKFLTKDRFINEKVVFAVVE